LVFNESVGWSVSNSDFEVNNLTNPALVGVSAFYNGAINSVNITFPGVPVLPDADYRLTVKASGPGGGIQDVAGNSMVGDFTYDFFFMMADANHDRTVNLVDFNIVAANFGESFRDFTQGDFTYDLLVNLSDFNLLAARFGTVLAGPSGLTGAVRGSTFGQNPIGGSKSAARELLEDVVR
jgi:hypothetical protein